MKRLLRSISSIVLFALPALALAQGSIQQGGPRGAGRVPMYVTGGTGGQTIVQDSGPAAGGTNGVGLSELGITARGTGTPPYIGQGTGPGGTIFCLNDAPINNPTGYHYLCMSPNTSPGGGMLSYGAAGGAAQLPLFISVNGSTYSFPFVLTGVIGPATSTVGHLAVWNNTTGSLLADGGTVLSAIGPLGGDLTGTLPNPTIVPSVGLTGNPTAPTPPTNDISTRLATTAFTNSWGNAQGWMKFPGITAGTRNGNTSVFGTTSGPFTPGNFLTMDGSGNIVDGGNNSPLPWISVKDYKASGSNQSTTGTVNGTTTLTLAAPIDFLNGQGIRINGAGPSPTVGNPSGLSAVYTGAGGSTTYSYRISSLDTACGTRTAISAATASSAAALGSLGYSNFVTISWSPGAGASRYAVWRSIDGGAYSFLTVVAGTSFVDGGWNLGYTPECVPATPPGTDVPQWLVTSVVSGGGTNTITLGAAATQNAVGLLVQHDDTVAINAAVTAGGAASAILLPCGVYKITNSINLTYNDQSFRGMGYCTDIQGYGVNDDIKISGVSLANVVSNVSFTDLLFRGYNKIGGKTLNARYFFQLTTNNIAVFNPWGGAEFYNFNTLVITNWRINRWWGTNEPGYLFHSGPTGEYACCVYGANLTAVGLSKFGGFSGVMLDKPGFWFEGNVATIQGYSWSSIEIEGKALHVTNNIGNTGLPQFFNVTDLETEFTNDRAVNLEVGLNFNFNNAQIHGARENNVFIGPAVSNVNFHGGLVSGAKADGFYVAGTNVTIGNMQVYDNSNPGSGGTAGVAYGIEFTGTARRFSTSNVTLGTPATASQQFCGVAIQAGADHFNVSGVSSADSNVNGGACNNTGGTSSSKIISVAN